MYFINSYIKQFISVLYNYNYKNCFRYQSYFYFLVPSHQFKIFNVKDFTINHKFRFKFHLSLKIESHFFVRRNEYKGKSYRNDYQINDGQNSTVSEHLQYYINTADRYNFSLIYKCNNPTNILSASSLISK